MVSVVLKLLVDIVQNAKTLPVITVKFALNCDLCNQGKITTSGLSVPVGNVRVLLLPECIN